MKYQRDSATDYLEEATNEEFYATEGVSELRSFLIKRIKMLRLATKYCLALSFLWILSAVSHLHYKQDLQNQRKMRKS